ncbi:response regulator [Niveispirillum sp. SYP-B3756]|uniref:response regulator transcription factor n=1 Tax=Niveispirillum sp. SYP-B3756 TaxID=2662178 RepID=UPI0012919FC3|nr:response regulator [Niveispirillum sp. SYP-B3756]MQP64501.1 response regulator [Niveispirillum sp. SYP-B3756]
MRPRTEKPTVVVIDDDESVREALCGLFQSVGLQTKDHGSVQEFLHAEPPARPACLVLDIRLPGRSGLEFQESLARDGSRRPVVLISAHVDVPMTVRAMKAGAVDVLTKPVREEDLLEAVYRAISLDAELISEAERSASLCARYATLTERERQVMALVTTGLLNKQIAAQINITEATVKLHRGHVMRKMAAGSLPELVRMSDILGVAGSHKM